MAESTSQQAELRAELRETARRLLTQRCPSPAVRRWMAEPDGYDSDLWQTFAELGWTGLEIPERYGGSGLSFRELAVILEELGRVTAPGPLFATAVLATGALAAAGSEEQRAELLPRIAAGDLRATVVLGGPSGRYDEDAAGAGVRKEGTRLRLDGSVGFIPDAHTSEIFLVVARDEEGLSCFLVPRAAPGIEVSVTPTVDQTRRLCRVVFRDVTVDERSLLGDRGAAGALAGWLVDRAAAGLAADSLGGAERALEISVEYAKQRIQFDRPIGSFQAVKHHCANMLIAVESSRVAAETAAREIGSRPGASSRWPAIAKSHCADAYARVAGDGVQVHGGIGFTWEHDMHLYLKRAKLNQAWFGSSEWHRERLARTILAT